MASQILQQDNILRSLFSTMRTASAVSHLKNDLAAFQKELRKIDNSIDAGQAEELHKEYKKIAEKIVDFDNREFQVDIFALTMENELLELILESIKKLGTAKNAQEEIRLVRQNAKELSGPIHQLKIDMGKIMEVVNDLVAKLESIESQLKSI